MYFTLAKSDQINFFAKYEQNCGKRRLFDELCLFENTEHTFLATASKDSELYLIYRTKF
jgi:hypothetical protein